MGRRGQWFGLVKMSAMLLISASFSESGNRNFSRKEIL